MMDDTNVPIISATDETLDRYSLDSNDPVGRLRLSFVEGIDEYQEFLPISTLSNSDQDVH